MVETDWAVSIAVRRVRRDGAIWIWAGLRNKLALVVVRRDDSLVLICVCKRSALLGAAATEKYRKEDDSED